MSQKIVQEFGEDGVIIREGVNQPYALVSLNTIRSIVTSLQDAQSHISQISDKEAAISIELIRDKLNPILGGLEDAAKELGVEIQIANPEFDYERARRELEEAMKLIQALEGPDGPDAA